MFFTQTLWKTFGFYYFSGGGAPENGGPGMVAYTKGARMPKAGRKKRRPTQKARAFRFGGVRPRNRQWAPPSLLAFGGVRPRNRQWALPLSWALGASDHAHTILAVPRTHLQTILAVPRTHLQNTAPSWYPQLWRNRHDEPHPQASARLAAALAWQWVTIRRFSSSSSSV